MKKHKLAKAHTLRVRISEYELVKLNLYAQKQDKSVSQIIRDYIKRLPAIKMTFNEFKEYFEQTEDRKINGANFNISLLKEECLTLEEWLKTVESREQFSLHEWAEVAGW